MSPGWAFQVTLAANSEEQHSRRISSWRYSKDDPMTTPNGVEPRLTFELCDPEPQKAKAMICAGNMIQRTNTLISSLKVRNRIAG
jgi:hypothetical protein